MRIIQYTIIFTLLTGAIMAQFETDTLNAGDRELVITFIGHGTLMLEYAGKVIHVDPWTRLADYQKLPDADLVLVTHHHFDHLDPAAIKEILTPQSTLVCNPMVAETITDESVVLKNGESYTWEDIRIDAVPAYNPEKTQYHPRGRDNGYVLTLPDLRVYIAGDTEDIPEMTALQDIDIAFLPMNQPYTMTPEQAAHAARMIKPQIVYPYHYSETDPTKLVKLLRQDFHGEVRIRNMQ